MSSYVLYEDVLTVRVPIWRRALTLLLAVAIGLGSHASKESLAPAEPALEQVGLGAISYALLTISPIFMGAVTPLMWGAMYDRAPRWAVLLAPLGEGVGAAVVALGMSALAAGSVSAPAGSLLLTGLLISSFCKAGVAIALANEVAKAIGDRPFVPDLAALFLAAIAINEVLGPLLMKWGLQRAGETPSTSAAG